MVFFFFNSLSTSQVVLIVKNLPANARYIETWVLSLGQEDTLEKEMAATPVFMGFWEIPWTEEPGRLQSMGSQRV